MNDPESINALAAAWASFALTGLVGSAFVLAVVALLWRVLRRRASASLGAWLFLLVMVKPFVPVEVAVPGWPAPGGDPAAPAAPAVAVVERPAPAGLSSGSGGAAAVPVAVAAGAAAPAAGAPGAALTLASWAFVAWLGLVSALVVVFAVNQIRFGLWCRRGRPLAEHQGEIDSLAAEVGTRSPSLVAHPGATTPFVCGLVAPKLVVPAGFFGSFSPEGRRWVLLHELAHLKRGDLWTLVFQRLAKAVFLFNPAVWIASRQVDRLREFACDDLAVSLAKSDPRTCGESFLAVIEQSSGRPLPGAAALALSESHSRYRDRLRRLIATEGRTPPRASKRGLLLLAAAAVLCLPNLTAQRTEPDAAPAENPLIATAPTTPEAPAPPPFRITISSGGKITTSPLPGSGRDGAEEPSGAGALRSRLTQLKDAVEHPVVIIAADRQVPFERVRAVLDECHQLGLTEVRFATAGAPEPDPPAAAPAAPVEPAVPPATHPPAAAVGPASGTPRVRPTPPQAAPAEVETNRAGRLRPAFAYNLSAPVPGTVVEITVQPRSRVEKGQVLARLDPSDAEIEIQIARARVEEAKAELLVQETAAEGAERSLETALELAKNAAVSQTEIDSARAAVETSRAMIIKARASLAIATAQLQQKDLLLERHSIRAPADGSVISVKAYTGQNLDANATILTFSPDGQTPRGSAPGGTPAAGGGRRR